MNSPQSTSPSTTTTLTVGSTTRPVHYTMFSPTPLSKMKQKVQSQLENFQILQIKDTETIQLSTQIDPDIPFLSAILRQVSSATFTDELQPELPELKPDFIPTKQHIWTQSAYNATNPTLADVTTTYMCLLNATLAHNSIANNSTEFSDQTYFSLIGIATSIRNAHFTKPTVSPFTPAHYSTPEIRFHNLLTQMFDIPIPDKTIHALLLYQTNPDANLYPTDLAAQKPLFDDTVTEQFEFRNDSLVKQNKEQKS